jgi:hypothetical protein
MAMIMGIILGAVVGAIIGTIAELTLGLFFCMAVVFNGEALANGREQDLNCGNKLFA